MLLLLAALPSLFWDHGVDTAQALRDAGMREFLVPAERLEAWKHVAGFSVSAADLKGVTKLTAPGVKARTNEASASRDPWIDSNGSMFLRQPQGRFVYDVSEKQTALAAAEAYCFGADAIIRTDAAGLKPLVQMLDYLRTLSADKAPSVADIGLLDDGSQIAGEVMNLLVRANLLFRIVPAPDRNLKLTVRLGSKEYPPESPNLTVHRVRANLTDDRRTVRIYGSSVVVARLTGSGRRVRLRLINYAAAARTVNGLRVRVLGRYPNHTSPGGELLDYTLDSNNTEFTLRELKTYAEIDLSQ